MGRESKDEPFVLPSPSGPLGTPHQATHGAAPAQPGGGRLQSWLARIPHPGDMKCHLMGESQQRFAPCHVTGGS